MQLEVMKYPLIFITNGEDAILLVSDVNFSGGPFLDLKHGLKN